MRKCCLIFFAGGQINSSVNKSAAWVRKAGDGTAEWVSLGARLTVPAPTYFSCVC